jgi:NAD+-dependent protein deacetylase SIR2
MVALEAMSPSSPLSSPLSSIGSRSPSPPSPSPPADYPSPPSTDVSDTGITPSKSRDAPDRDEPPPAKRQKIMKPRDMKTEHLDLRRLNDSDDGEHHKAQDHKLNRLMEVLRSKKKIVVIAGAGISVSAGSTFNLLAPNRNFTNIYSPRFPFFNRFV